MGWPSWPLCHSWACGVESAPSPRKTMEILRPLRRPGRELCEGGPDKHGQGRKQEAAVGLMEIIARIWDLPFFSLHTLPSVALFQQSTAFLWSQVRRTVRDTCPVTLTSIMRARKGSLWINRSRKVQHEAGMAGVCTILPYAKPWGFSLETLQCKERRLEGHQAAPEPWCLNDWRTSLSGLASGPHALVLDSEAMDFQAI